MHTCPLSLAASGKTVLNNPGSQPLIAGHRVETGPAFHLSPWSAVLTAPHPITAITTMTYHLFTHLPPFHTKKGRHEPREREKKKSNHM